MKYSYFIDFFDFKQVLNVYIKIIFFAKKAFKKIVLTIYKNCYYHSWNECSFIIFLTIHHVVIEWGAFASVFVSLVTICIKHFFDLFLCKKDKMHCLMIRDVMKYYLNLWILSIKLQKIIPCNMQQV